MNDLKNNLQSNDDDLLMVPENQIEMLRNEVDDLKRCRKDLFSRINDVSKGVSTVCKYVSKVDKKNKTLLKTNLKIQKELFSIKEKYTVEQQLKNEYKQTIDDLENNLLIQDDEILHLQIAKEDLVSDKTDLMSRLSKLDEKNLANLEAVSINFEETKNIITEGKFKYQLTH